MKREWCARATVQAGMRRVFIAEAVVALAVAAAEFTDLSASLFLEIVRTVAPRQVWGAVFTAAGLLLLTAGLWHRRPAAIIHAGCAVFVFVSSARSIAFLLSGVLLHVPVRTVVIGSVLWGFCVYVGVEGWRAWMAYDPAEPPGR